MIEWNRCYYVDCMNEENGLPTLEDKSIDLCLTDPPFLVDYITQKRHKNPNWKSRKTILYEEKLNIKWFKEALRIGKSLIFTCGEKNIPLYCIEREPDGYLYNYKSNGQGFTTIAKMNRTELYLCYGIKGQPFNKNTFESYVESGFLSNKSYIHPHPKSFDLWYWFINSMNPKSVFDPFMGSGTTAEVCTKLGIPWLGYEINEIYSHDINLRLKNCKKEPIQMKIIQ